MRKYRKAIRISLSLIASLLFIPLWVLVFKQFNLNGWGVFHSGLPLLINGFIAYWLLGNIMFFKNCTKN